MRRAVPMHSHKSRVRYRQRSSVYPVRVMLIPSGHLIISLRSSSIHDVSQVVGLPMVRSSNPCKPPIARCTLVPWWVMARPPRFRWVAFWQIATR